MEDGWEQVASAGTDINIPDTDTGTGDSFRFYCAARGAFFFLFRDTVRRVTGYLHDCFLRMVRKRKKDPLKRKQPPLR